MKVAVVGKGGSGKTTVAALLARGLARQGWSVVALDCDANPNLGIALGLGLVTEPTPRSLEVSRRAAEIIIDLAPGSPAR